MDIKQLDSKDIDNWIPLTWKTGFNLHRKLDSIDSENWIPLTWKELLASITMNYFRLNLHGKVYFSLKRTQRLMTRNARALYLTAATRQYSCLVMLSL